MSSQRKLVELHVKENSSQLFVSAEELIAWAKDVVAPQLPPGAIVGLVGELGMGKTTFVRGLVEGLGGDGSEVSSPTYVLQYHYSLGYQRASPDPQDSNVERVLDGADSLQELEHWDLYRLTAPPEELVFRDPVADVRAVCIEWVDKFPELLSVCDELIQLTEDGEARRVVHSSLISS